MSFWFSGDVYNVLSSVDRYGFLFTDNVYIVFENDDIMGNKSSDMQIMCKAGGW